MIITWWLPMIMTYCTTLHTIAVLVAAKNLHVITQYLAKYLSKPRENVANLAKRRKTTKILCVENLGKLCNFYLFLVKPPLQYFGCQSLYTLSVVYCWRMEDGLPKTVNNSYQHYLRFFVLFCYTNHRRSTHMKRRYYSVLFLIFLKWRLYAHLS